MGLFFMFLFGVISALIAHGKGRSGVGWFFLGFFFSLFGLIGSLIVSDLAAETNHRQSIEDSNRRLREQLRQEKLKNQRFREHALRRIDAHDQQLGVDTRRNELAGPSAYRYLGSEESDRRTTRDRAPRDRKRKGNHDQPEINLDPTLDLDVSEDEDDPQFRQLHWN
ncbi:MAG: hypothetical protein ACYTFT_09825 [Planctomycetota bacterium]|jgi:hypothetical protein